MDEVIRRNWRVRLNTSKTWPRGTADTDYQEFDVELYVDLESIVNQLAHTAVFSKGRKATAMAQAVILRPVKQ